MSFTARLRALFAKSQEGIVQATAVRHPFFDRCQHGTQFLNECRQCPDGRPVVETPAPATSDDLQTGRLHTNNQEEGNSRA